MFIPSSTYRIQFTPAFTFKHLEQIADYLVDLGITGIYASPILRPAQGSQHGYDGIDPSMINPELGSLDELQALSQALKQKGIGWIQDIVPNHLSFDTNNVWLTDVLERGTNSTYSTYFDIDWEHPFYPGKLMTPFLEAPLEQCIAEGKINIQLNEKGFFFSYASSLYPISIETYPGIISGCVDENSPINALINSLITDAIKDFELWKKTKAELLTHLLNDAVLEKLNAKIVGVNSDHKLLTKLLANQYYVLCYHMDSNTQINYRRFFNVNSLICLKIENEEVFTAYHKLTLWMYQKNMIDGLRIDHIDGLKNPAEYIRRLRRDFGSDCYIIVEKILDAKESLPETLDIQGTSGYEFLSYSNQLLTDAEGAEKLVSLYNKYVPAFDDYDKMVFEKKLHNLKDYLNGEWDNLVRLLLSLNLIDDEEIKLQNLKSALGAFMAAYPVYRAYIESLPLENNDQQMVNEAFAKALKRFPELRYELSVLENIFKTDIDGTRTANRLHFVQRLMQFTGPLAAKGVEDTVFYLYNPLISHNEVGDAPCYLSLNTDQFHDKMIQRAKQNPFSFNCTSTHDTKRGEDNRIRINIISELVDEWTQLVAEWQEINEPFRQSIDTRRVPYINDEYFLYQAIVGGFPEDFRITDEFRERTKKYFTKVMRESKLMSDHINPNTLYERVSLEFIDHLFNPQHSFLPSVTSFVKRIIKYANIYSMVQSIIKMTAPGIPDIYQGCELWDLSYVDPDNRRPVNFEWRINLLKKIRQEEWNDIESLLKWTAEHYETGAQKMYITEKMLNLRKRKSALFRTGNYIPIKTPGADRKFLSYLRELNGDCLLVVLPLAITKERIDEFSFDPPGFEKQQWKSVFTNEVFHGKELITPVILKKFPVAVFECISE